MSRRANGGTESRVGVVEKRVTTMKDGRYLIYYSFPAIDSEFEKLREQETTPVRGRSSGAEKN